MPAASASWLSSMASPAGARADRGAPGPQQGGALRYTGGSAPRGDLDGGSARSGGVGRMLLAYRPGAIVIGHFFDSYRPVVSPCCPGFILRCLTVPYVDVGASGGPAIREPKAERNAATVPSSPPTTSI
jgi:hypothetical protein